MSGVLVLVVLLGMWAFVLVPLVRHRNERADEIRSVARFSSALRVLSRGHGHGGTPGMRQWVMPPRAGIAAARARRIESESRLASAEVSVKRGTVSRTPVVGAAARRRRTVLLTLGALVVLTLLLAVVRRSFLPVQVATDVLFLLGAAACKWSADHERERARRARRRAATARRRALVASAPGVRRERQAAPAPKRHPVTTVPLQRAEPRVMTVPLDAPVPPRRAVPDEEPAEALETAAAAGPQRLVPPPSWNRGPRQPVAKPVAEPVVLAEIDLEWEPAVAEPASGVRLVDLTAAAPARRTKLFDDAEPIDLGDDAGLEALISRRAAASGW